ncbi:protein ZNRD2-like [Glandiceps talaboti]
MSGMDPDDYTWEPPTESQMKILQAKRERTDKISAIMGDYLLKGYKMLGTCCDTCGTILLRDKQQRDYCIACNELDSEHAKDNPVLSSEAARVQAREYTLASQSTSHSVAPYEHPLQNPQQEDGATAIEAPANMNPVRSQSTSQQQQQQQQKQQQQQPGIAISVSSTQASQSGADHHPHIVDNAMEVVNAKLAWATEELARATSVEKCSQLCELMKACAEALVPLEQLKKKLMNV